MKNTLPLVLCLALALPCPLPVRADYMVVGGQTTHTLFGYPSIFGSSLESFPKWREVLTRTEEELRKKRVCTSQEQRDCTPPEWTKILRKIKNLPIHARLEEVNTAINSYTYVTDPANWNLSDYWATPFQFFRKNGDCEDYAIAKYMLLKASGVPVDSMRIVVVQDLIRVIAHAVLEVEVDGVSYILDNQMTHVVVSSLVFGYQPVYSVREDGWWIYRNKM